MRSRIRTGINCAGGRIEKNTAFQIRILINEVGLFIKIPVACLGSMLQLIFNDITIVPYNYAL